MWSNFSNYDIRFPTRAWNVAAFLGAEPISGDISFQAIDFSRSLNHVTCIQRSADTMFSFQLSVSGRQIEERILPRRSQANRTNDSVIKGKYVLILYIYRSTSASFCLPWSSISYVWTHDGYLSWGKVQAHKTESGLVDTVSGIVCDIISKQEGRFSSMCTVTAVCLMLKACNYHSCKKAWCIAMATQCIKCKLPWWLPARDAIVGLRASTWRRCV